MGRKQIAGMIVLVASIPAWVRFEGISYGSASLAYLAVGCILALFWFAREFTDSFPFAVAAAALLASWLANWGHFISWLALSLAALILVVGLARHRFCLDLFLPGALAACYVGLEVFTNGSTLGDLAKQPHISAILGLVCFAAYSRYERIDARRQPVQPTPLDLPATRTSIQLDPPPQPYAWIWAAISLAACAAGVLNGALALPIGLAILCGQYVLRGFRARLWLPTASLVLTAMAVFLGPRLGLQISSPKQTFTNPNLAASGLLLTPGITVGLYIIAPGMRSLFSGVSLVLTNLAGLWELRRQWIMGFSSLALAYAVTAPGVYASAGGLCLMLSTALRAVFVIALVCACGQAFVIAASPQALQAPRRLVPAPGSLPRP